MLCAFALVVSAAVGISAPSAPKARAAVIRWHPVGDHPVAAAGPRVMSGRSPGRRLADVSLEVIRLGEASRRVSRSYEARRRAELLERAESGRLHRELDRARRLAATLRRRVGAIADAQYRTGSLVAYTVHEAAAEDHKPLVSMYEETTRRERALAARLGTLRRAGRVLADGSALASARAAAFAADRERLGQARARADRGLDSARDMLRRLASQVSRSGSCGTLPSEVTTAARAAAPVVAPSDPWTRPVENYELSSPFGGSGAHWASRHTGQDFAVPVGTPVRAVGAGRIESLSCGDGFGISMVVRHHDGLYTQYAHLSAVLAGPGHQVAPGERIALSGDTGNSTGPHLHFEVRHTPSLGSGVDPVPWLREHGVTV
ncbi:M23 family metallopeptidase [Streptomyces natalensis]|uniref:M23 family metallopeptidase n=1 Tax=Streptomyces natalensis TaxID=68242 RepID=UPI000691ADA1|nr:M23 family metallopeptidase [Streptomyces natalensis]